MRKQFMFMLIIISLLVSSVHAKVSLKNNTLNRSLVGHWTFDDPENLTEATVGNDLELVGNHVFTEGPT